MTAPLAASDLAARLVEVAARLDSIGVVPRALDVTAWRIGVQLADEGAVDRAADLFPLVGPAGSDGGNYARSGFINGGTTTVDLYSPRTIARCACGSACNHREVAS